MFLAQSTFLGSSVCISRSLYLSVSLATYVRLSLEVVCLLDALQRYSKTFMLNMHWRRRSRCCRGGDLAEGEGDIRGGHRAQLSSTVASGKQGLSPLFSSSVSEPVHLFGVPVMPNKSSLIIKSDRAAWEELPSSERPGPSYSLNHVLVTPRAGSF